MHEKQEGATLIETMLAILILLIVVIAGAAFLYHSSGSVAIEGNRRVALEAANSRLEEMRVSSYNKIKPPVENYRLYYIEKQEGTWPISDNDPEEKVNIDGLDMPITTTVQYVDDVPGDAVDTFDYILAVVEVGYRRLNLDGDDYDYERVALKTYFGQ